jgi:hypothetical protein
MAPAPAARARHAREKLPPRLAPDADVQLCGLADRVHAAHHLEAQRHGRARGLHGQRGGERARARGAARDVSPSERPRARAVRAPIACVRCLRSRSTAASRRASPRASVAAPAPARPADPARSVARASRETLRVRLTPGGTTKPRARASARASACLSARQACRDPATLVTGRGGLTDCHLCQVELLAQHGAQLVLLGTTQRRHLRARAQRRARAGRRAVGPAVTSPTFRPPC